MAAVLFVVAFLPVPGICAGPSVAQLPQGSAWLDPDRSAAGFELRARWGQRIDGRFPVHEGQRRVLADGRHQVRLALDAGAVDIEASERLSAIARGERFFDVDRHPRIEFLSDPYPSGLLVDGGEVRGWLELRGVRRPEVFTILPASCERPGEACPVQVEGTVARADYGMDAYRLALGAHVHFSLQLWLRDVDP